MNVSRILLALPFAFFSQNLLASKATELDKIRSGEVITTHQKTPGSKYDTVISKGVIQAPVDVVFKTLTDFENYEKFIPRIVDSAILKTEENIVIYKSHVKMPWPIPDILYHCKATLSPEKSSYTFELVPGTGKGVKNFAGGWKLEVFENQPQQTLAEYTLNYEPERNYPAWMVRLGSKSTIERNIHAIRARIKELSKTPQP